MRKRRKRGQQGHGNNERWLITYSDLITLLMIFFVVLYAMSKIDVAKFMTLSESLNQALYPNHQIPLDNLGNTSLLAAQSSNDQHLTQKPGKYDMSPDQQRLQNLYQEIKEYIQKNGLANQVSIENQVRGVQVTLRDVVLFNTGEDVLTPEAQKVLGGMTPFLTTVPNDILVEGFTDNRPIDTPQFPSNWELSTARAVNVLHFLADGGVAQKRMAAVGYGEWQPIKPNDSDADRQQNRRVNIVILREDVTQSTANAAAQGAGGLPGTP